jgi:MFS family permease
MCDPFPMTAPPPPPAPDARHAPGPFTFAGIYTLESAVRAVTATVIPLQAYALLGETRLVSIVYFVISIVSLIGGFILPYAIQRFGRGKIYGFGAVLLMTFPLMLATQTITGQVLGMAGRALGSVCTVIALQLYIMDYIAKRDLVRSEPLRFQMGSLVWAVGPGLGVYLYEQAGPVSSLMVGAVCGALVCANFLRLGLQERTKSKPPGTPLANIRRFIVQPRLRLAWTIAFGRTVWWGMCMVYVPLHLVRADVSAVIAAMVCSAAVAMMFFTPIWGRIAMRFGVRRSLIACFALLGICTLGAAIVPDPYVAAALIVLGGFPASGLDGVGGLPFLRAVHPYERAQMAGIYRTYVELGDMISSAVYAVLLTFFDIPSVFTAAALLCLGSAYLCRYLPRTL